MTDDLKKILMRVSMDAKNPPLFAWNLPHKQGRILLCPPIIRDCIFVKIYSKILTLAGYTF